MGHLVGGRCRKHHFFFTEDSFSRGNISCPGLSLKRAPKSSRMAPLDRTRMTFSMCSIYSNCGRHRYCATVEFMPKWPVTFKWQWRSIKNEITPWDWVKVYIWWNFHVNPYITFRVRESVHSQTTWQRDGQTNLQVAGLVPFLVTSSDPLALKYVSRSW